MIVNSKPERIQKILSVYGVTSRREAERMIPEGRIKINDIPAVLGQTAIVGVDDITIDGKPLPSLNKLYYIMLNKPRGYVTSMNDDLGRKVVTELVTDICDKTKLYPVGRLDINSEGLLILTNDGKFANTIMHPRYGLTKTYEVHVRGDINSAINKLKRPIEIDSQNNRSFSKNEVFTVKAVSVDLLKHSSNNAVIEIVINEGRNKQVRKMCKFCGLDVLYLKRVAIGSVKLGNLPLGKWRHLSEAEIGALSNNYRKVQ